MIVASSLEATCLGAEMASLGDQTRDSTVFDFRAMVAVGDRSAIDARPDQSAIAAC